MSVVFRATARRSTRRVEKRSGEGHVGGEGERLTMQEGDVVIVATAERAKDGPKKSVYIVCMQSLCAGGEEATSERAGIYQQDEDYPAAHLHDLTVYRTAAVNHANINAFYRAGAAGQALVRGARP